jgi:hypothetical protein
MSVGWRTISLALTEDYAVDRNSGICLFTSLSCQTEPGERLAVDCAA